MNRIAINKGWQPDYAPYEVPDGGLITCQNLLPYNSYYAPARNKSGAYSATAVDATPLKGYNYKTPGGVVRDYIGTTNKLYEISGTTINDRSGAAYSTGSEGTWDFAEYGSWVIATNFTHAVQVQKGAGNNFEDLGGSPPNSKFALFYSGHLILANHPDYPKKLTWSAFESIEDYVPALATGADEQDLADMTGHTTGLAKVGSAFAILAEDSVSLGWYTGAPYTFNFKQNVVVNDGCIAPGSIVVMREGIYFWSKNHIIWFDGKIAQSIGGGVEREILDNVNSLYVNRITSAVDYENNVIFWSYPSTNSSDGTPDKYVAFNWLSGAYTITNLDHEFIHQMFTGQKFMDDLDTTYPSWDAVTIDMDSGFWKGNVPAIAVVDDADRKIKLLSGTAMTGLLTTKEFRNDTKIVMIDRIRALIDTYGAGTVSVRVGSRWEENDSISYSSSSTVGANGYADLRHSGRLVRIEVTTGEHDGFSNLEAQIKERRGNR